MQHCLSATIAFGAVFYRSLSTARILLSLARVMENILVRCQFYLRRKIYLLDVVQHAHTLQLLDCLTVNVGWHANGSWQR